MTISDALQGDVKTVLQATDGKKTYAVCIVGILVILCNHFIGTVPGTGGETPYWLDDIYKLILVMTGRSALTTELKN